MVKNNKYNRLIEYLKKSKSVAIAFSGGVDSTFLLKCAKEALQDRVLAITIVSPYIADWEIDKAKKFTQKLNIKHKIINVPILDEIRFNPSDRCYICKKNIFSLIKDEAKKNNIDIVADGTNADDINDYRPGIKALKELKIVSPLLENNITKGEVREMSKDLELETWDKPSYSCLLSRIPYKTEITEKELSKIQKSEMYLISIGFTGARVRSHNNIARIEVQRNERKKLFNEELLDNISNNIKKIGYQYVTVELEGYKVGSLNKEILNK